MKMNEPILVFDMDGVLVDVTESYRETIAVTVEHFTGARPTNDQIQQFKNRGGFNDDWELTHYIVTGVGFDVPFEETKAHFQKLFLGSNGTPGLIEREKWIARPGVLEKLAADFRLAVFTGRPREEADLTLRRFAPGLTFHPIVAMEDVALKKPAPDGLLAIAAAHPTATLIYIGDSIDDARSARAAKVPFIGVAAPSNPAYLDLVFLFQEEHAHAIVDDMNYLHEVFAQ
ncbi:MAG TPA: TIGR01548 family HAD-type hydrolase [Bryobacteraceae bacterium]|nr:TIGR01548 family HAD-type hydrolase [Bryobacteraceae bacterium]